jgi:hypothetical protein
VHQDKTAMTVHLDPLVLKVFKAQLDRKVIQD